MKKIIQVYLDDEENRENWEALYINGNLVAENHSIDLFQLLHDFAPEEKFGNLLTVAISYKQIEKYGCHCPNKLPKSWEKKAK